MNNKNFFKYCFGYDPDTLPGSVIITPFIKLELFKEYCNVIDSFRGKIYSGIKAAKNGKEFCVIKCGIGGSMSGDAAILLAQSKASNMVFLGACGGFGDCEIGDIVIGERAFNGEGFSRYYNGTYDHKDIQDPKNMTDCSNGYTGTLEDLLYKKNISFKKGDIYTIGSMVAEDKDLLMKIEGGGFKAVEMELSAVYNGGKKSGIKVASLLFVSDLPLKKPIWEVSSSEHQKRKCFETLKKIIEISVEFMAEG